MFKESKAITGPGTFVTQYGYNSADLMTSMRYPENNASGINGELVSFAYQPQMLLNSVTGSTTYVAETQYDASGRVDLRKLGTGPVLQTDYVYFAWTNQGGRMQFLKTGTPGNQTSLQSFAYNYDAVGNINSVIDNNAGGIQTQTFTNDALNRLSSASASGGSDGTYGTESYNYFTTTGNLQTKAGVGYSYTAQSSGCPEGALTKAHAVTTAGTSAYCYDQNGNMRKRTVGGITATLSYDPENRMTGVSWTGSSATYAYDGDGNRVKATVGAATTAYVGNYFEWSGSTSTMVKYYYAGGTRVAMRTGAGSGTTGLQWLFGDHLGSSSRIANADGTPYSETRYKPWGETRYGSGGLSPDMIFKDGFESGDFSTWTSSTTDGGDLSVTTSAALKGTKGMQVVVDDANLIYATDDTPTAEPRYRARFYFDPNSITFASLGFAMVAGYSGTTPVLRLDLFYSSGSYKVRARILKDDGNWLYGSYINISDAPHYLELDWKAATAPGANNGSVSFWVDGVSVPGVTGVDNDTHRIDRVRLGEPEGGGAGIAGTIYIDAFESRKGTYIGAEAPTDVLFTGQRLEEEIGLYYYGARWYDTALGRFAQPDTIVPGAGNPLSWDRYSYTQNNPTRYTDSTGHMIDDGCRSGECRGIVKNPTSNNPPTPTTQPPYHPTQTPRPTEPQLQPEIPGLPDLGPHYDPGPTPTPMPISSNNSQPLSYLLGVNIGAINPFSEVGGDAGIEVLIIPGGQIAVYTYKGGGTGVGIGGNGSLYVGVVSGVESPEDYEGIFTTNSGSLSISGAGVQGSVFYNDDQTVGGLSIGYAPGARVSLTYFENNYELLR
jgi:RHS repeat-associated protein